MIVHIYNDYNKEEVEIGRLLGWMIWTVLTTLSLCTMVIGAQIVGMTQDPQSTDMIVGVTMLVSGGLLTTGCIAGITRWVLRGERRGRGGG
ncbi:MAG: hypothetical protein EXS64_07945 [Candidatus Latescibacteria bacterium]|nr:hypothetical protein [Candidatus Latescibacterota bacterium]